MTRAFCAACGTHMTTRRPGLDAVVLKIGTLDDPTFMAVPRSRSSRKTSSPSMLCLMACISLEKLPPTRG